MAHKSTDVKIYRYTDIGSPEITGAPGSLIALLNTCLVTGYGSLPVTSITRDLTTVTVNISIGHSFSVGSVINIDGADQSEYNGEHRIDSITNTLLAFELNEEDEPVSPATGTSINIKVAPAKWERTHVSGDLQRAAFRSLAADSTKLYLYLDDTNIIQEEHYGSYTKVKGYESIVDIDTRFGGFPFSVDDETWYYWKKRNDDDITTTLKWIIISDDKYFWFYLDTDYYFDVNYLGSYERQIYAFGDIITYVPGDAWHCIISGDTNYRSSYVVYIGAFNSVFLTPASTGYADTYYGCNFARDYLGSSVSSPIIGCITTIMQNYSEDFKYPLGYKGVTFPNPITGGPIYNKGYIAERPTNSDIVVTRGIYPGLRVPLHAAPYYNHQIITGIDQDENDILMIALYNVFSVYITSSYFNRPEYGQVLIDILGPWR